MPKLVSFAALGGVAALFLISSYFLNPGGNSAPAAPDPAPQDTSSQGSGPTLLPDGEQTQAPDFTLNNVQTGQSVQLSTAVKTEPVVFSFWATWCGPCNMELPVLNDLSKKYNGRVQFYGINSNDDDATIRKFIAAKGYTIPMLGDPLGATASAYSVQSIPRLVIVGTDGKIKFQVDGFDPNEANFLPGILDQVLGTQRT